MTSQRILLYFLGSIVIVLHILGYAQPQWIIGSRVVNRIAIPSLLAAAMFLSSKTKIPVDIWKKDRPVKLGGYCLVSLLAIETLLYAALMFNVFAGLDPKYVAEESNPTFQALESRLAHLMVFSVLGCLLWTPIVVGLREQPKPDR